MVMLRYIPYAIVLGMLIAIPIRTPVRRHVDVFVIDSNSALMPNARAELSQFRDISHGEIVSRIVKEEAPAASVTLVPVDDATGAINTDKYLKALQSVLDQVRHRRLSSNNGPVIMNMSLGSHARTATEESVIHALVQAGVIVVAAAGNDGDYLDCYPASFTGVIAVAAADGGALDPYSNWSSNVSIAASGFYEDDKAILTEGGAANQMLKVSGTSFAAPRVTGLIADQIGLGLTDPHAAIRIIQQTGSKLSAGYRAKSPQLIVAVNANRARAVINPTYWYHIDSWRLWLAIIAALLSQYLSFSWSKRTNRAPLAAVWRAGNCLAVVGAIGLYLKYGYPIPDDNRSYLLLAAICVYSGACTRVASALSVPGYRQLIRWALKRSDIASSLYLIQEVRGSRMPCSSQEVADWLYLALCGCRRDAHTDVDRVVRYSLEALNHAALTILVRYAENPATSEEQWATAAQACVEHSSASVAEYAQHASRLHCDPNTTGGRRISGLVHSLFEHSAKTAHAHGLQNPDSVEARDHLGLACLHLGRLSEAASAFRQALKIDRQYAPAYYGLGAVLGKRGLRHQETNAYRLAIRLDPACADAHAALGAVYLETGDYRRARDQCKILHHLDSTRANKLLSEIQRHEGK